MDHSRKSFFLVDLQTRIIVCMKLYLTASCFHVVFRWPTEMRQDSWQFVHIVQVGHQSLRISKQLSNLVI